MLTKYHWCQAGGIQQNSAMDNSKDLRQCLGKFATGVMVVTCCDSEGRPCGITANSFSSVSLAPPLVLWNIAKVSNSLHAYLEASHFAINILSESQVDISKHFARSDHTCFNGTGYTMSDDNAPLLPDTLGHLECKTAQIHEAGDHFIIVGEVVGFSATNQEPLVFFGGDYTSLENDR
jgi:3-hydroxy-9,10-secoandrosta-1,3,5(10)-triene-9,17-dione monooxygenase reductase component